MKKIIKDFLNESNKIEGVFDKDSLQQAMYAWEYLEKQKEMSIDVVLKTHKILMLNQNLRPNEKGYFRTCSVWIGGREGLKYPMIRQAMDVWCRNVWLSPEHWKRHHIRYEIIHPFVDGNGRTGRMFMNWERLKVGLPIKVIKNSEKQKYYNWFKLL